MTEYLAPKNAEATRDQELADAPYPPPAPILPKTLSPTSLEVIQRVARERKAASSAKPSSAGISDDMAADSTPQRSAETPPTEAP